MKQKSEKISEMIFDLCQIVRKNIDKGIIPDCVTVILFPDGCKIIDSHYIGENDLVTKRETGITIYDNTKQDTLTKF